MITKKPHYWWGFFFEKSRANQFVAASCLTQCEDIERDRLRRPLFVDEAANFFGSLTRESRFAATFANLRWNMFDQNATIIDREYFAHNVVFCGISAADVTLKHFQLRFRWSIHSFGSGS